MDDWIVGKNNHSHMRAHQKTQNHTHQTTGKHKIAHQKTKKSHTRLPKSDTKIVAKDTKSHSTRLQKNTHNRHRGRELGAQSQAESQSLWGESF